MPVTRIECAKFLPGVRARPAGAARGAIERRIVQQERHLVLRELYVDFVKAEAERLTHSDRGERVLRRVAAAAAVRDDARIGPGLHARPSPLCAAITTRMKAT